MGPSITLPSQCPARTLGTRIANLFIIFKTLRKEGRSFRNIGKKYKHLFQLRLLLRRMMHDPCPRCITVASQVNFVPATSLETQKANAANASMLCQKNVKTMYFKTLSPRLFNLRQ